MAEDGGNPVQSLGERARRLQTLARNEGAVGDLLREQLGGGQRLPVREATLGERAQDVSACVEDVAVRVAERAVLDPGLSVRYESSFFRMPRKTRNRRQ